MSISFSFTTFHRRFDLLKFFSLLAWFSFESVRRFFRTEFVSIFFVSSHDFYAFDFSVCSSSFPSCVRVCVCFCPSSLLLWCNYWNFSWLCSLFVRFHDQLFFTKLWFKIKSVVSHRTRSGALFQHLLLQFARDRDYHVTCNVSILLIMLLFIVVDFGVVWLELVCVHLLRQHSYASLPACVCVRDTFFFTWLTAPMAFGS